MAAAMIDAALLKKISVFGGLAEAERALVLGLLEERDYEAGATVVAEGSPGSELFVIASGEAEVLKRTADGREARIAELGPGACFGEMALVGIMPRSATVRAKAPLHALVLPFAKITRLSKDHLQTFTVLVMNLAREVCRRLRVADAVLGDFGLAVPRPPPGSTWAG
jgi:CRP-like cAMP-binding protein